MTIKKIYLAALLVALSVTVGYLFIAIPNLEMITASIFISGFLTGPLYGLLIGAFAEFLYSFFNPMGAPIPPLLVAQVLCMMLAGFVGGLTQKLNWLTKPAPVRVTYFAATGFILTLVYDILTTLSFVLFAGEPTQAKFLTVLLAGSVFYLLHQFTNAVIFALLVPLLLIRLRDYRSIKTIP